MAGKSHPTPRGARAGLLRPGRRFLGALALAAAAAAGPAAAQQPAPKPQSPPRVLRLPEPQAQPARPAAHVWTLEDLERLRAADGAVSLISDETPHAPFATEQTPEPAGPEVLQRYVEMLATSQAELERLQRERLAAVNPFLRGLARDRAGNPAVPRSPDTVDADIERWKMRQAEARSNLERMAALRNRTVEELTESAAQPAPPPPPVPEP